MNLDGDISPICLDILPLVFPSSGYYYPFIILSTSNLDLGIYSLNDYHMVYRNCSLTIEYNAKEKKKIIVSGLLYQTIIKNSLQNVDDKLFKNGRNRQPLVRLEIVCDEGFSYPCIHLFFNKSICYFYYDNHVYFNLLALFLLNHTYIHLIIFSCC